MRVWRWGWRAFRVLILLSGLVLTPLLGLAHFSANAADFLADLSQRYLPRSTVLASRDAVLQKRRLQQQTMTRAARRSASRNGRRVLLRGAATASVGWIPIAGLGADLVAMQQDYSDLCELFAVMDALSATVLPAAPSLYRDNYCHLPEQGLERLQTEVAAGRDLLELAQ